jgi:hypothetical protein
MLAQRQAEVVDGGRPAHLEKVNWRRMVSGRITRPFCIAMPKASPIGTAERTPDHVVADISSNSPSSSPPTSSYCCVLALCATASAIHSAVLLLCDLPPKVTDPCPGSVEVCWTRVPPMVPPRSKSSETLWEGR